MAMPIPGTDLRSIPNDTPISPLGDMSAVDAVGEAAAEGEAEVVSEELKMLIQEVGPENVMKILEAIKGKVSKVEAAIAEASEGPKGALSGMGGEEAPVPPMM